MRNRVLALLVIVAFVFVSSCETMPTVPDEHKGAATGAGVGAAAGAVLGGVLGKDASSAVIGGLIGALVGGAIGHYYYDQKRTGTETANKYGYDPRRGPCSKSKMSLSPRRIVSAGGTVDMKMTYACSPLRRTRNSR